MGTVTPRSRALIVLGLLVALCGVLGAGCTDRPPPGAVPSGGVTGAGVPTTPTAVTPVPVEFPTQARAYAEAILAAWQQRQLTRLAELTVPEVYDRLVASSASPGWVFRDTEGAAGSVYCRFQNGTGQELVVQLTNQLLGMPHAAVDVRVIG